MACSVADVLNRHGRIDRDAARACEMAGGDLDAAAAGGIVAARLGAWCTRPSPRPWPEAREPLPGRPAR